jgi:hypothetical protein
MSEEREIKLQMATDLMYPFEPFEYKEVPYWVQELVERLYDNGYRKLTTEPTDGK